MAPAAQRRPAVPEFAAVEWPACDPELLASLPPVLRAIVRALGFTRAREWLADHGGVGWNVPAYRPATLGLLPDELARLRLTLAPHMDAAGRVSLPKVDKLFHRARNTQIRRERPYTSLRALALKHRLTVRQVMNICREVEDERDQLDLF